MTEVIALLIMLYDGNMEQRVRIYYDSNKCQIFCFSNSVVIVWLLSCEPRFKYNQWFFLKSILEEFTLVCIFAYMHYMHFSKSIFPVVFFNTFFFQFTVFLWIFFHNILHILKLITITALQIPQYTRTLEYFSLRLVFFWHVLNGELHYISSVLMFSKGN